MRIPSPPGIALQFVVIASVALTALPAFAHVALLSPSGGEVLVAGSTTTVSWVETVNHGEATFDLSYSTTGEDGPWESIASGLEQLGGEMTYEWTVPNTPSTTVRVRVRQNNTDYEDFYGMSAEDLAIVAPGALQTVQLMPNRDATLYEGDGSLANGSGMYLFSGGTAQSDDNQRRALLAFDLAQLPASAIITEVALGMNVSKAASGTDHTIGLHRVLASWTEGPSDAEGPEGSGTDAQPGDATWVHRSFPDVTWSMAGGDVFQTASAAVEVGDVGYIEWATSDGLVADVQGWLDDPTSNHGWALIMASPVSGSAKRFDSREASSQGDRPTLTVTYMTAPADAPTAAFGFDPAEPVVGETIQFTDASTGGPTSWSWDFGDGGTSIDQNPSHTYADTGTYTVTLMVSNDVGTDSTSRTVTAAPEVVPPITEVILIPGVANARGAGDSFFVTTLDILNSGSTTAIYMLLWLPRDQDNGEPVQSTLLMLEPGEVRRVDDVLGEVFGLEEASGVVAILTDSSDLLAMARTFNLAVSGTFGQSLPGVTPGELFAAGDIARVLFLTQNDGLRSNLGLVNGGPDPMTIRWELFAPDGTSFGTGQRDLPAWGNVQINRVLGPHAPVAAAYAHVWTDTPGAVFTCYGSVLDAVTDDPTTIPPR